MPRERAETSCLKYNVLDGCKIIKYSIMENLPSAIAIFVKAIVQISRYCSKKI